MIDGVRPAPESDDASGGGGPPGEGDTAGGSSREARLEALLQRWFLARDAGEAPEPAAFCREDPDLLPDLRRLIARDGRLQQAFSSLAESEAETELPFERVGEFRLLRPLGEGGMGRVYLAVQESLDRRVAIKILRTPAGADPVGERRFQREAEITASLDHPNIVPVFAVGEEAGFAWIAMKFLSAPSLDRLDTPLSPREAARIGAAVARALHEAHLAGVIHRDVKPANVVVDQGTPFILDFGLARSPRDVSMTREGAVPGTLLYMSPEQIRGDEVVLDARSDVYSLGATLYEAVSGRAPFDAETPEAILRQILLRDPPPLSVPPADRDFATIISRAMEKERERRFATGAELADELERYLAGEPIRTRHAGLVTRVWRLGRRHRRTALALGSLALLLLVLGVMFLVDATRKARVLDETRDLVRAALDRGDHDEARALLATWLDSYPEDRRLLELRREARGLEALANLLDHIQGNPFAEAEAVRTLIAALDAQEGLDLRPPLGPMSVAFAHILAGERERASALLARLDSAEGSVRGLRALRDLADARDPVVTLRTSSPPKPDDSHSTAERRGLADQCVFAALALRMVHAPEADREREIDAALDLDPGHYRATFERARLHSEQGRHALAESLLRGLADSGRRRLVVLLNIARESMHRGDLDRAETYLQEAMRRPRLTVGLEHLRLEILWRRGHAPELLAALDQARKRWPEDLELMLFAGEVHASRAEGASGVEEEANRRAIDRAEGLFRKVKERAAWPAIRQAAESALLQMEFSEFPGATGLQPLSRRSREEREELEELRERIRGLSERAVTGIVRGQAHLLDAMALWLLDRRAGAWQSLEAAIEADPQSSAAHLRFALQVVTRLQADPDPREDPAAVDSSRRLPYLVPRARRHAARVRELVGGNASPGSRGELLWAWKLDAILALHEHDAAGCLRAIEALEAAFESGALAPEPGDRDMLSVLRQRCEASRR